MFRFFLIKFFTSNNYNNNSMQKKLTSRTLWSQEVKISNNGHIFIVQRNNSLLNKSKKNITL